MVGSQSSKQSQVVGLGLQLGDVTGAFLEADELKRNQGKLYMSMPSTYPLDGYHREQLFEIVLPLYGLNDSPQGWFVKFSATVRKQGWQQSRLDPCVFFLRDDAGDNRLIAILGVHVDDVLIGGADKHPKFNERLKELRQTFPFRKWQCGEGTFCGSYLKQCQDTYDITVSQAEFL